jgi:hypothetical protein
MMLMIRYILVVLKEEQLEAVSQVINVKCFGKLERAFKSLGKDNFDVELVERFKFNYKNELLKKESEYIILYDTIDNGYNSRMPLLSYKDT